MEIVQKYSNAVNTRRAVSALLRRPRFGEVGELQRVAERSCRLTFLLHEWTWLQRVGSLLLLAPGPTFMSTLDLRSGTAATLLSSDNRPSFGSNSGNEAVSREHNSHKQKCEGHGQQLNGSTSRAPTSLAG